MRFIALLGLCLPLAAAAILRAFGGDPFATSIAAGFVALFVLQHIAAREAARPAPRKADPAKIARLERELGIGEAETREMGPVERAVTTPFEHPHMDSATFHGAPAFGHKIEGP